MTSTARTIIATLLALLVAATAAIVVLAGGDAPATTLEVKILDRCFAEAGEGEHPDGDTLDCIEQSGEGVYQAWIVWEAGWQDGYAAR